MTPFLVPIEKPRGVLLRLLYWFTRRQFGLVPTWLSVFSARMPLAFTTWMGKAGRLQKKLKLSQDTAVLVRARIDAVNGCTWCMDAGRWYAGTKTPHLVPRLDALGDYETSPLFSDPERAALAFATELAEHKTVSPDTFETLRGHYCEREVCEIVWLVSSNHLFNINNLGLGIGSQGLCQLSGRPPSFAG